MEGDSAQYDVGTDTIELGMGLDWAVKRHQAIANNIANIDTPGYKRQDVAFPEVLAQAVKVKAQN